MRAATNSAARLPTFRWPCSRARLLCGSSSDCSSSLTLFPQARLQSQNPVLSCRSISPVAETAICNSACFEIHLLFSSFVRASRTSFFSRLFRTLVSSGPQVHCTPPLRSSRKRCSPLPGRVNRPVRRPRRSRPEMTEEKMRVISQAELSQMTRPELMMLLRRIAAELPNLSAGSGELRNAHANLQNIRRALAAPSFRLG